MPHFRKFNRIGEKLNHMIDEPITDPVYLPFTINQLLSHFINNGDRPEKSLTYYQKSISLYHDYCKENPDRRGFPITDMKRPAQIEKDERFWVVTSLMSLYHSGKTTNVFVEIFKSVFGDTPPFSNIQSWEECLTGDLRLYFEVQLPSSKSYKEWLRKTIFEQQIIPYVIEAAYSRNGSSIKKNLEGPTHADALLLNLDTGFAAIFEAKVLSDISYQVSFDITRNQIARNIDVMLESNESLHFPLDKRNPDKTCFVLLTPGIFKEKWQSRLYGWLMRDYQFNPTALARDLPHRDQMDWTDIARKIGWLTFEDCNGLVPGACPWFNTLKRK